MSEEETVMALHDLLMSAPDAQRDDATGMHWCPIDDIAGDESERGLAEYILAAIRSGKIPGLCAEPKRAEVTEGLLVKLLPWITELAAQKPEKPDYWSSCGQCDSNISEAEDFRDLITAALSKETT